VHPCSRPLAFWWWDPEAQHERPEGESQAHFLAQNQLLSREERRYLSVHPELLHADPDGDQDHNDGLDAADK